MLEEDVIRLREIVERIDLIQGWTGGLDESGFMADIRTRDAVALNIQMIGEQDECRPQGVGRVDPMVGDHQPAQPDRPRL